MEKRNICQRLGIPSDRKLLYFLLLAAGILEFLLITMEGLCGYVAYYLAETYLVVPALLFVGIALTRELTPSAKRKLYLALAAVIWFVLVQIQHRVNQVATDPFEMLFFAWLMAFPFAEVTQDRENIGLTWIGKLFVAASLILVGYSALLLLDCLPGFLEPFVFWDGTRLHAMWHPNTTSCVFMIGIGFSLSFLFQAKTLWGKVLLGIAVALQFLAMALTNCRTSVLMTCAFLGGVVFLLIWKGGWKRFVLGAIAAVVVMAGLFLVTSNLYELHTDIRVAEVLAEREQLAAEAANSVEVPNSVEETNMPKDNEMEKVLVNAETGELMVYGVSGQGSLSNDMRTLNGRTWIWKAALDAIRDQKSLLLWGTEYSGLAISVYNRFPVEHAHNSWVEVLLRLGLPGLLTALAVSWIAVHSAWVLLWNLQVELWKKMIAVMVLCVMVASFLEPYLFITRNYYQFIEFIFFFGTGYLAQWREQLAEKRHKEK